MYYVSAGASGVVTILMYFTLFETLHHRPALAIREEENVKSEAIHVEQSPVVSAIIPEMRTYWQNMAIYRGTFTEESFPKMLWRPFALLALPPIQWATLVQSINIGALVGVSSVYVVAYTSVYGFTPLQASLTFIAALVGTLVGFFVGGVWSDKVADHYTRRNDGIREPEMRLPAIIPSVILATVGLIIYGLGFHQRYHWMVPTLGLGLSKLTEVVLLPLLY